MAGGVDSREPSGRIIQVDIRLMTPNPTMGHAQPDSAETELLLRQAAAGDAASFEDLFSRYRNDLLRVIELRMEAGLRARFDASDVVQEAQFEAFRRLADYLRRRPMPFRLWLRKTAQERLARARREHVATQARSLAREVTLPDQSSLVIAEQFVSTNSSPSQQIARIETARFLQEALARLSEIDREILLMRNFEQLSYDEISVLLGIEAATARKRFGRALRRLREQVVGSPLAIDHSEPSKTPQPEKHQPRS